MMAAFASSTALRGELRRAEPMAAHVSWRAGGAARVWYRPADAADLGHFLAQERGPVLFVGLGSNLLVRDGGWPGAVVNLYNTLDDIDWQAQGRVRVGAGVHCATLAAQAARRGWAGATFLGGIPGTIGGALAMNAGAWGGETWPVVRAVTTVNRQGQRQEHPAAAFQPSYRSLQMPEPEMCFVAAELEFAPGADAGELQTQLKTMLAERRARQPVGRPSCGSVFRNPPGHFAAELIERAGLKGAVEGGAEVSTKHANFILNRGAATAADIETLMLRVQRAVRERFGIGLQAEVRIVGEPA